MISWPEKLIERLARRNVVILIGSGVSANSVAADGTRPPTWHEFLESAKHLLDPCPRYISKAINEFRYLDACEYLKESLGSRWDNLLSEKFLAPNYRHADIHKHIFNLDVRIVISLNFDMIYDKFVQSTTEYTYIIKNYNSNDVGVVTNGNGRYLLKMHGSIDTPADLIFTSHDYAQARVKNREFYSLIDALLITHSFLIVGCGLNDPDVKLLFENYRKRFGMEHHYMTMSEKMAPAQVASLLRNRGINILNYRSNNNHEVLIESLQNLVELVNEKREIIARDMAW